MKGTDSWFIGHAQRLCFVRYSSPFISYSICFLYECMNVSFYISWALLFFNNRERFLESVGGFADYAFSGLEFKVCLAESHLKKFDLGKQFWYGNGRRTSCFLMTLWSMHSWWSTLLSQILCMACACYDLSSCLYNLRILRRNCIYFNIQSTRPQGEIQSWDDVPIRDFRILGYSILWETDLLIDAQPQRLETPDFLTRISGSQSNTLKQKRHPKIDVRVCCGSVSLRCILSRYM